LSPYGQTLGRWARAVLALFDVLMEFLTCPERAEWILA
jgi:hypothetical protein